MAYKDLEKRRQAIREHYARNPEYYKQKAAQRNKRVADENMAHLLAYLLKHPCTDCGESDPVVLDFDHREDKTANVSDLLGGYYSWERVLSEIEKCDVRCANCHRRKTALDFGWRKAMLDYSLSP